MTNNIAPSIVYPIDNGYVNDLKPAIQGTGEPGASINGMIDATPFSALVSENGVWYYKSENELANLTEHTVSFSQTSPDGQVSPQTLVKFRIDTQMLFPHALVYPKSDQFINTKSPTINGTGKPGATIEANLCGSVYNTVVDPEGNWQIKAENLPEGSSFMHIIQKDMGNISPAICAGFMVDTVAPSEPSLDFPYDQGCINNPVPVFCGKGEPNASIDATVDEKKYAAKVNSQGLWSFEISEPLVDDTHIVSTRQIDMAGNISPESICVFTIKTIQPGPPVISNPVSGSIIAESEPVISGQGENDCVVMTRIYDKIYSTPVNSDGSWKLSITDKLADGTHTFKIYQVDEAGNVSNNVDWTIKVDTSVPAPPVVIYPQKGGYVNKTDFQIRGTGEPDATIICSVAGEEYTTRVSNDGSWSVDLSGSDNIRYKIDYIISAKQIDLAGNCSNTIKTEFCVDTNALKAPIVSFPENGSSINTVNPLMTGTGKAGATINLSVNSKDYSTKVLNNGTWAVNIEDELQIGENTINITQTDCGNISPSETVKFNVKLTTPTCPVIISPTTNQNINTQDLYIIGKGEAGAKINIRLDDDCYTTTVNDYGTWKYSVSGLLQGAHSILVNQTDTAGNESFYAHVNFISSPEHPNVAYENGPTSYQIFYNPPGPELTTKTIVTLKTGNPVTVNDIFGNVFSFIVSTNGLYDFNYSETGGGRGVVTAGVSWIDNQPPVIQIDSCGNYFSSEKIISYHKYGGSCIKNALLNNAPFMSGKRDNEEGVYKIEVTDKAGNFASDCFIIDKTPPEVFGVENNMVYNTDVTINYSDDLSGVKSAMLNGRNVLSGCILTGNGDYTLKVTDYADNVTERSFKILK
ncbi:MAG: hypothetical protein GXY01_00495 [Clostridiales bacterium]|nr:hypothetical protein [Clostridiales bacterium]